MPLQESVSVEAEIERLRRALEWAQDAMQRAGGKHDCDYCRADAATLGRVLEEGAHV